MSIKNRITLYHEIEAIRKRPLIAYIHSNRSGIAASMQNWDVPEVMDQINLAPKDSKMVDVLIVSDGGDPNVAWKLMSLLREHFETVSVLIPHAAYSAATLFSLGANEIVMHPNGNLGPVDPQISIQKAGEVNQQRFGYEDISSLIDFAKNRMSLTGSADLKSLFDILCQQIGTIPLGVAVRASFLLESMGNKLLMMHQKDEAICKGIIEKLTKAFHNHNFSLGRNEAKKIGLAVSDQNIDLENRIWAIWNDVELDLEIRKPFNPMNEIEKSKEASKIFAPIPQLSIPAGVQVQIPVQIVNIDPIPFEVTTAVIESSRKASHCVTKGNILAQRTPDLQIFAQTIVTQQNWINKTLS